MPPQPQTSSSTRRLSDVARHLVLPDGIVTTGYPAVEAQCRKMGVEHDDWQRSLAIALLAKRLDGKYAAGVGGVFLSTCRQVGKTFTMASVIFALCALNPGTKVLWTAHHTRTTDDTFEALEGMALRPRVAPFVEKVLHGSGKQAIRFKNRSSIQLGARERGFGRGIPGVSIVVFDEAQILSTSAVADMVPAANTIENPLIIYTGTPPKPKDDSELFKSRRRAALSVEVARAAGESTSSNTLYAEIGADPDADLDDRDQWAKGNPSYPKRTPEEAFLRQREQLDPGDFRRDALGIWDSDRAGSRAITVDQWQATGVDDPPSGEGNKAIAVAFSVDGLRLSVGAALHNELTHVELVDAFAGNIDSGLGPLADWFVAPGPDGHARWRSYSSIILSGRAGAGVMAQLLRDRGVLSRRILLPTSPQYFAACAMLLEAAQAGTISHRTIDGQRQLDSSVAVSDKKIRTQDGAFGWAPTTRDGDETPLEAVSLALWGARTLRRVSSDRERKALVL